MYLLPQDPQLWIGLTELTPSEWRDRREPDPRFTDHTWSFHTYTGLRWAHGKQTGDLEDWRKFFGTHHALFTGDALSLGFTKNRTMTVTYRDRELTAFSDLPDKPLYVSIYMGVKKLQVVPQ